MKKRLLVFISVLVFNSCSSVKNTQEAINSGNYETAMSISIDKLKKNKTKKGNQPYVVLLEDGFKKFVSKKLNEINYLEKDQNPEKLENIYTLYSNLKITQNKITPLLPLYIQEEKRDAAFEFDNYDSKIIEYKNKVSEYLYVNAKKLFTMSDKLSYRKAFDDLQYINKINPNYKDVPNLMNNAHNLGVDYVFVSMKNETQKVVPKRLEDDLLNFDTYGLDDFWTIYHSRNDANLKYDFNLELSLRSIQVSPEQIKETASSKEREIEESYFKKDAEGNFMKDTNGNKIELIEKITVRSAYNQIRQFKSSRVVGQIKYVDNNTQQVLQVFPIESEFVFEHIYATYKGDKRALREQFIEYSNLRVVSFPSNEQMIYDTGSDLKNRLKTIITRNKFRN